MRLLEDRIRKDGQLGAGNVLKVDTYTAPDRYLPNYQTAGRWS